MTGSYATISRYSTALKNEIDRLTSVWSAEYPTTTPPSETPRDAPFMPTDPFRKRLRELLLGNDLTMKSASLAIGRNHSFLQQYLTREHPRVLRHADSEALADLLGCKPDELRHPIVPPRMSIGVPDDVHQRLLGHFARLPGVAAPVPE